MTMARTRLVDSAVTRRYHCVTRRCDALFPPLSEGPLDPKQWIVQRLHV